MKIGIYNRYWNTFGGGEKYIGSIAQFLKDYGDIDLIGNEPFSVPLLETRLSLKLAHCRTIILDSEQDDDVEKVSREYDLWINISFKTQALSNAKHSILIVMFPYLGSKFLKLAWRLFPKNQPEWVQNIFWEKYGFWRSYDQILAISPYTQFWIEQWWGEKSQILLPPVDLLEYTDSQPKKKIILSVGRFFFGGHSKKQDVLVRNFKKLIDCGEYSGWEYHLCGGTHPEPKNQAYLNDIIESAKGYPIHIHPDINRDELIGFYRDASIFWHASGYGEDEIRKPEQQEHFGITTVEAMSAGCIPVVLARGGQKGIINHGNNGFLWDTINELNLFTTQIMNNPLQAKEIRAQAVQDAKSYSYDVFTKNFFRFSLLEKNLKQGF